MALLRPLLRATCEGAVKLGTVAADLSGMRDSASEGSNPERRRQPRVACIVTVLLQAGNVSDRAHLADLSPEGVHVLSALQPGRGYIVRISFETPEGHKVELTGSVIWSKDSEFGVRVDDRNEAYQSLVEILSSLD